MIRLVRKRMFEMAFDKKEYQRDVDALMDQIAQNWCLCMYCHLFYPEHRDYHGWKKELRRHLNNLIRKRITSGDKERYTREIIITKAEFNTLRVLNISCDYKFAEEESLMADRNKIEKVYALFINDIENLVLCISGKIGCESYLNERFPDVA